MDQYMQCARRGTRCGACCFSIGITAWRAGLDWQAMRTRYRPQAASARNREETAVAINAMLAELGASHTHYYTPEEPAYYQLADIFDGALERRG